jgi:hypothetical protein
MCAYLLGKTVGRAWLRAEIILFHNDSTSQCGIIRKNLSE